MLLDETIVRRLLLNKNEGIQQFSLFKAFVSVTADEPNKDREDLRRL
jgi:hypothetical protein